MAGVDVTLPEPPKTLVEADSRDRDRDTAGRPPLNRDLHKHTVLFAGLTLVLITPGRAWAYLDPGTGSYVIQVVLAALFGALVTLRLYWQKVRDWFKGTTPGNNDRQSAGKDDGR